MKKPRQAEILGLLSGGDRKALQARAKHIRARLGTPKLRALEE